MKKARELDKALLTVIEEASKIFENETLTLLLNMAMKKKLLNTRELINSLSFEDRTDLARAVHSIDFALRSMVGI